MLGQHLVAYSMLGSVNEAEDAVQECWLRLDRSNRDAINDLRAWLTTAVGRICLDMLRARKSRREHHAGIWLPEPLITQKFIAACSNGDLSGLLDVMTPDAWGDIDLGPAAARLDVVTGARSVAGNLLRFWGQGATLVSHPVAGQPAVLAFIRRELAGVLVLPCAASLSRRSTSSATPASWTSFARSSRPWPSRAGRAGLVGLAGGDGQRPAC